jgi:CBS domain-containing protein
MSRIPPRKAAASMVSGMSSRVDDSHSTISTQSMPQNLESARSRQNRRDETIRKRFQSELMKKSGSRSGGRETQSVIPQHLRVPGTVGALRPTQALTVREAMTVLEAARLMAAKRADCVLVVDSHEHLAGIFTAKDLAFRVVAEGQEARNTTVRDIMTRNPFCVTADTPATDALTTMVKRRFRHLPVCNDEGDVVGLLDITRCMSEALEKMERAYNSSRKLYEAVEGVEREWSSVQPAAMMQFVEALREKMSFPTLGSVLNEATHPVEIGVRSNVREAAQLMKAYGTTAVITKEGNQVAGIFTSKDVVLRVIAAGLNPDNCTLVRVMTPHPDVAPPTMTLLEALRKMYDGRYLNLPVMDNGILIGMVDVLRLTYHTLEQASQREINLFLQTNCVYSNQCRLIILKEQMIMKVQYGLVSSVLVRRMPCPKYQNHIYNRWPMDILKIYHMDHVDHRMHILDMIVVFSVVRVIYICKLVILWRQLMKFIQMKVLQLLD